VRYTAEKNPDIRDVPAEEVWVGAIDDPKPHVAIATRSKDEDELVLVCRFKPDEARQVGQELIRLANTLAAPNN
jgi:hypothetical protein